MVFSKAGQTMLGHARGRRVAATARAMWAQALERIQDKRQRKTLIDLFATAAPEGLANANAQAAFQQGLGPFPAHAPAYPPQGYTPPQGPAAPARRGRPARAAAPEAPVYRASPPGPAVTRQPYQRMPDPDTGGLDLGFGGAPPPAHHEAPPAPRPRRGRPPGSGRARASAQAPAAGAVDLDAVANAAAAGGGPEGPPDDGPDHD